MRKELTLNSKEIKKSSLFLIASFIILFTLFRIAEFVIKVCYFYSFGLQQYVNLWDFTLVFIICSIIPATLFLLCVFIYDNKCGKTLFAISCGYISIVFLWSVINTLIGFTVPFDFLLYFTNFGFDIIRIICYALVAIMGLLRNRMWVLKIVSISVTVFFDFVLVAKCLKNSSVYYRNQDMMFFCGSVQKLVGDISFFVLSISVLLFVLLIEKRRVCSAKTNVKE